MQLKSFVQKHSLFFYFVLAFAISWGASVGTLGPKFLRGEPLQRLDAVPGLIGMILGPFISGVVMTWIVDGGAGVRALFSRMGKWNARGRWWAAASLLFPGVLVLVLLVVVLLPVLTIRMVWGWRNCISDQRRLWGLRLGAILGIAAYLVVPFTQFGWPL